MPQGREDFEHHGEESDESDAIPTASRRWFAATDLERFDLLTSDVDGYEGEDGNNSDADEEEEASPADAGSTQNLDDWGHSTSDWGHSTR